MNIALINQWYPPASNGGVAKYNYHTAQALRKLGHTVFVITERDKSGTEYSCDEGIHVFRIPHMRCCLQRIPWVGSTVRFVRDVAYSWSARRKLQALAARCAIDIVEYAEINAEGFFHSVLGPRAIPFVVRCHTPYFVLKKYYTGRQRSFDHPCIDWMEKSFIRRAPCLTAPSNDLAGVIASALKLDVARFTVVPNAIDTTAFSPGPAAEDASTSAVTVLYVGRMERSKGVYVLAEALAELAQSDRTKLRCIFVGHDNAVGSVRGQLRDMLRPYDKTLAVTFTGAVSERELIEHYRSSDIVVNPSLLYESFSYTCLEAMACAKPVVASRIGGIPELVEDGKTGLLFSPGDSVGLAATMRFLVENRSARVAMGRQARLAVESRYDVQRVAERTAALFAGRCRQ